MTFSRPGGEWLIFQNDLLLVKSKDPFRLPPHSDEPLFRDRLGVTGVLSPARGGYPWGEYPSDQDIPKLRNRGPSGAGPWAAKNSSSLRHGLPDDGLEAQQPILPRCGAPMNPADNVGLPAPRLRLHHLPSSAPP